MDVSQPLLNMCRLVSGRWNLEAERCLFKVRFVVQGETRLRHKQDTWITLLESEGGHVSVCHKFPVIFQNKQGREHSMMSYLN